MTTTNELRHFLRAHRDELVLSVYLEARPADPAARRQRHVHLRQQVAAARERIATATHDERELFERLVQVALDRMPGETSTENGGSWACFCAAGGRVLELTLPPGIETSVHWGLGAFVVPYVRVAEPEAALIAQLDRGHARLTRWQDGQFDTLFSVEAAPITDAGMHTSEAPRPGFHPGTRGRSGADDAQRQRREDAEKLQSALLQRLAAVPGPELPIIVGGSTESVARLLKGIPANLADRTIEASALRMEPPQDSVPVLREVLNAHQARRLGQRVEALRDAVHANGLAATGLEQASKAAARGAVAELIFSDHAWRQHPDEVAALVQRVMLDGADVAWAGSGRAPALDGDADGLVAGLRFALSGS